MRVQPVRRRFHSVSPRAGRVAALALALVATLALSGCGGDSSGPPPPVERVARQLVRSGATSAIVSVSHDGEQHVATAGARRPSADQRFRVGSVTKTFTAALVLQLVDEQRIRLDDALDKYLPGVVPAGRKMTIRRLLRHESGLANVTDYPAWLLRAESSRSTRPIDSLRFAAARPLVFQPGTSWGYSNTNYIALGLIVERATGRPFRQVLEGRILEPLELTSTELPTIRHLPDLRDKGANPNVAWAAGAIVSNGKDLSSFFSALLAGRVVSRASLARMKQTTALGTRYGLGIFFTGLPCGRVWGHNGGILDYGTLVEATEDGSRVAVVSIRGPAKQLPDEAALLCPPRTRPAS